MSMIPRKPLRPNTYTLAQSLPREAVEELRLKLRRDQVDEAYRQDRASYRDVEDAANEIYREFRLKWAREDEESF